MRSVPSSHTEKYWLCLPDGTIVWEPTEADYELWREEERDLQVEADGVEQ